MMLVRALALLLALSSGALAQSGQIASGTVWGNPGASKAIATSASVTAILDRALGSTRGSIIERGASGWALIGPGATVGLPLVTNGTGADPGYTSSLSMPNITATTAMSSPTITATSALIANTAFSVGLGGTGITPINISVNGSSGAAGGAREIWSKNSVLKWQFGFQSAISGAGTSDAFELWSDTFGAALVVDFTTGVAAFSSSPTAPTPATGDSSTKVATTAYVKANLAAATPSFFAHKNGVDQTGVVASTFTQVTFSTEGYDVGGYFASNAWTPPAGTVSLVANAFLGGTMAVAAQTSLAIYKNGVNLAQFNFFSARAGLSGTSASVIDNANGTDAYTVFVYQELTAGTGTVVGTSGTPNTFFRGAWLGP